ncbi:hypothetical protein BDN70DRAFT_525672 [Pholiota conissans]|uniref:Uncharacterized protein n=1 Tax=Pholiota conissans TaxID=109636 RepID=A0A9P5YN46_9AGAR|nr:hypothetical protein BDN70DRAFT_525672 [Pholiota conissans]
MGLLTRYPPAHESAHTPRSPKTAHNPNTIVKHPLISDHRHHDLRHLARLLSPSSSSTIRVPRPTRHAHTHFPHVPAIREPAVNMKSEIGDPCGMLRSHDRPQRRGRHPQRRCQSYVQCTARARRRCLRICNLIVNANPNSEVNTHVECRGMAIGGGR